MMVRLLSKVKWFFVHKWEMLSRMWAYAGNGAYSYDFDYGFALKDLLFKLKRLYKVLDSNGVTFSTINDRTDTSRRALLLCIRLLERHVSGRCLVTGRFLNCLTVQRDASWALSIMSKYVFYWWD